MPVLLETVVSGVHVRARQRRSGFFNLFTRGDKELGTHIDRSIVRRV